MINAFVRDSNTVIIKYDLRHFCFNAPNPVDKTDYHGYEMWVTIPDDFPVQEPPVKKRLEGGLYAAYMIPVGAFGGMGMAGRVGTRQRTVRRPRRRTAGKHV